MGVDISAYVEKKNKETNKWELETIHPIASRLKYIIEDYRELPQVNWEDLSEGLQVKFNKDEDGRCYAGFYATTIQALEDSVSSKVRECFTRLNMVVKALGCQKIYNDDGEEMDWGGDDIKEKLTFPINKSLVEDLQFGYDEMRKVGQKEMFDLLASEYMNEWDSEYRIVFVVC